MGTAVLQNAGDEILTEEDLIKALQNIRNMFVSKATDEDFNEAVKLLQEQRKLQMDLGVKLEVDDRNKWYFDSKSERPQEYWNRYYNYLTQVNNMPVSVVSSMGKAADNIMDSLGDPMSKQAFSRRGLVIGSVQSGKTSNYIALINKASDSGYKVIILLTGTIEKLRAQTQRRIDQGFVGMESIQKLGTTGKLRNVGVGKMILNGKQNPTSFTTTEEDFNTEMAMELKQLKGPAIFVVKKNKATLTKLERWLRTSNAVSGKINEPLLLIYDESDNASINTRDADDPTTINKGIRALLDLFPQHSYVGFTATPFANIFIDPFTGEDGSEDLFPKDFIYLLDQPTNYVGPSEMYQDNGKYHYMLKYNDDVEDALPLKHKKDANMAFIPDSLKESVRTFFVANAIRDLRGQGGTHRSMLIHISRFKDVQEKIKEQVYQYVEHLKREISNYALVEPEKNEISNLKNTYIREFVNKDYGTLAPEGMFTWQEVKMQLNKSVQPIDVRVINSSSQDILNYEDYANGLRVIAVGGLSLARGLTLEGLMTSYFYRNTAMYDTLMQMGRWFGYRDGYADLVRLWISKESADWYEHISQATEELRTEVKKMKKQNKTPKDFGLRVKSAPDTPLIVTARNKMRSAEKMQILRSLNGGMAETPVLSTDFNKIKNTNQMISNWFKDNMQYLYQGDDLDLSVPTLKDVPKGVVTELMEALQDSEAFPPVNLYSDEFVSEINSSNNRLLDKWDVIIASKRDGETVEFAGLDISPQNRAFDFSKDGTKFIRIGGSKKRLGTTMYARGGLTKKQKEDIEALLPLDENGKIKKSDDLYFQMGVTRNPLLVIYPINLTKPVTAVEDNVTIAESVRNYIEQLVEKNGSALTTGISVGIPEVNGEENIRYTYTVNAVFWRKLMESQEEEIDSSDEDSDYDE